MLRRLYYFLSLFVFLACYEVSAYAQEQLFQYLTSRPLSGNHGAFTKNAHLVRVDFNQVSHSFTFSISGESFVAYPEKVSEQELDDDGMISTTASGVLRNAEGVDVGNYSISSTREEGERPDVYGLFELEDGRKFELQKEHSLYLFRELDEKKMPECSHGSASDEASSSSAPLLAQSVNVGDSESRIDMLVYYTSVARDEAGGSSAMISTINTAISLANKGLENSRVDAEINLVRTGRISISHLGNCDASCLLKYIKNENDGVLDALSDQRNRYGADAISLIVGSDEASVCGLGSLFTGGTYGKRHAVNVVKRDCIGGHSFTHEFGHNLGAAHDRNSSNSPGRYSFSYGFHIPVRGNTFRTIMAYRPGERINYFSTPKLAYYGVRMGSSTSADNARTLNLTRNLLADLQDLSEPDAPILESIPNSTSNFRPEFDWNAVPLATEYDLYLKNETTGALELYKRDITRSAYTMTSDLSYGSYRVWVRAKNIDGKTGNWSSSKTFEIINPIPSQVVTLSPNGSTSSRSPTFTWNPTQYASRYELRVRDNETGALRVHRTQLTQTSYTTSTTLDYKRYRFFVRAFNSNGQAGPWSAVKYFDVLDNRPPETPVLGAITIRNLNPTIRWGASSRAQSYHVYLRNDQTNRVLINRTGLRGTSYTSSARLQRGVYYRVWVRARNSQGKYSSWSSSKRFKF